MKQKRLTAAHARKLSGRTLDEKVDAILLAIENKAENGERQLRTGWQYSEDKDLWVDGGYSKTDDWKKATDILIDLGFNVTFYYEESQFVDMFTLIKW